MKNQSIEKSVVAWLRKFARAYSGKDAAGVMALMEPNQPVFVLGSGPDENSFNLVQLKKHIQRDFAQVDKVAMKFEWIKTAAEQNVAWFACEQRLTVVVDKQKIIYPYRFTGVLVKRGKEWRLRMAQMGLVSANQQAGESWPSAS